MNDMNAEAQASDPEKTMVATAINGEATILGQTVRCPVCSTENAPNEKYCGECGFLLSSTPGEAVETMETGESPVLVDVSSQREFVLRQGENSIGREGTDVLLSDATVSRRHALLILEEDGCWVEDLGSTNGTYVAGKQIESGERVQASDGTELKFGSVVLSLRLPSVGEAEPSEESPGEPVASQDVDASEETADVDTEVVPGEVEGVSEESPVARLVSAPDPDRTFPITWGTNTVGRRAGNAVALSDDAYVSGSHAELIADERGFWLVDVGSTNGTSLNGTRVSPNTRMILNDGDEIVFGQSAVKFEIPPVETSEEEESGEESEASDQPT